MKKNALAIALSLAGMGTANAAAPLDLPLDRLDVAVSSPNGTWTPPPPAAGIGGPMLTWVHRGDLEDLATRNAVVDALGSGRAVLVTGFETMRDTERETFGYRSGGGIAAYWLSSSGVLETTSVDEGLSVADTRAILSRWLTRRLGAHDEPQGAEALPKRNLPVAEALTDTSADADYVPSLRIRDDRSFAAGRSIRTDIEVTRDISDSHDDKVIVVRSEVDQKPSFAGVFMPSVGFSPIGHGEQLWIADRYTVTNQLTGVDEPVPIRIAQVAPLTNGATDRAVSDKLTIKASSGLSVSALLGNITSNPQTPFKGKLAILYSKAREATREYDIAFNLKDYSIESGTRADEGTRAVDGSFRLHPTFRVMATIS